jgi:selenocysteine lyase/cysteine desulfurase
MCGPTGVGFLHGKFEILSSMEPFLGKILQGEMNLFTLCQRIESVAKSTALGKPQFPVCILLRLVLILLQVVAK